ncbi:endonuclease/exonuclease/phosphatase family protein [Streptosporangium sandarakinum]|uniref:endonuclease/exonuclease/phosphatase family protein n=1 Tax=Streptosporangium sandarakinum TaxID=1260955 RepID=UPI0033AB0FEE
MSPWTRGGPAAGAGVLVSLLIAGHGLLPDWRGLGNIVDSALPWFGLAAPLLVLAALARRSWAALAGALAVTVTWAATFGPAFLRDPATGPRDLRVVHQNVDYFNPALPRTAAALRGTGADVLVVAELRDDPVLRDGTVDPGFARLIDAVLPYRFPDNPGVAVWSRYPFRDRPQPVPGVVRSRHAVLRTPWGDVSLYAVHITSFRPEPSVIARRNAEMAALARAVAADPGPRVIVAGDLNTAATDRALRPLAATVTPVAEKAGTGLQLTWPAMLPLVRLDHVLTRGFTAVGSRVLPPTGGDHRAILADLRLAPPASPSP